VEDWKTEEAEFMRNTLSSVTAKKPSVHAVVDTPTRAVVRRKSRSITTSETTILSR
jgi:hypothetical protein